MLEMQRVRCKNASETFPTFPCFMKLVLFFDKMESKFNLYCSAAHAHFYAGCAFAPVYVRYLTFVAHKRTACYHHAASLGEA